MARESGEEVHTEMRIMRKLLSLNQGPDALKSEHGALICITFCALSHRKGLFQASEEGHGIQTLILMTCGQSLSLTQTPPFMYMEGIILSPKLRCSLGELMNILKALLITAMPRKRKLAYPFYIAAHERSLRRVVERMLS